VVGRRNVSAGNPHSEQGGTFFFFFFLHIAAGDGIKALTSGDGESPSRNKAMLWLSTVQVGKIATLRNKIALHENFMMVQPIAAGTQQTEVKKWRGKRSSRSGGR
jgi:hypothetical protein